MEILIFFIVVIIIFSIYSTQRKKDKGDKYQMQDVSMEKEKVDTLIKKNQEIIDKLPNENKIVFYRGGHPEVDKQLFDAHVWIENGKLNFHPVDINKDVDTFSVNLEDIVYYATKGEINKQTLVSGGEVKGGGSSITGAAVGGLVAGPVGAVIGSRKKVKGDPIKTTIVTEDSRRTFMNFSHQSSMYTMYFDYYSYSKFVELIPNKSYEYYSKVGQYTKVLSGNSSDNVTKMKELVKLREEGLITEEEFQNKRAKILSGI